MTPKIALSFLFLTSLTGSGVFSAQNPIAISLGYRLTGPPSASQTALLLHGAGAHGGTWQKIIPYLHAANIQTLTPDLRGHGSSHYAGEDFSPEAVAYDLDLLIEKLRLNSVHVVGHSLGARLGVTLATLFPHRVKSLVVIDLGLGRSSKVVAEMATISHPSASDRMVGASWAVDLLPLWARFRFPRFIIQANPMRGGYLPEIALKRIVDSDSSVQVNRFENAGHSVHITHAAELSEVLLDFLNVHCAPPKSKRGCWRALIEWFAGRF